jgi:hypothetical protein
MKTFTKIAFLLISAFASVNVYAQCTPDTNMPKGSILPETLQYAYHAAAYSEVIYFRAPEDTVAKTQFGELPARIDSMEITGVAGLPDGITYSCNNGKCLILGGEASCVTITGTPTVKGEFPVKVYIKTYATIKSFVDIPVTQDDSVSKYTIYVFGSVGIAEKTLAQTVSLYPNPAHDVLNISSTGRENLRIELMDLTGRRLAEKQVMGKDTIDLSQLSQGIYVVRMQNDRETYTQKIVVE